jgi:hypothetical protein
MNTPSHTRRGRLAFASLLAIFFLACTQAAFAGDDDKSDDADTSVYSKEGKVQKKDGKNVVDFEETSISGARKVPLGTTIDQGSADKDYDFVEIRKEWHKEMIKSAGQLDTPPK